MKLGLCGGCSQYIDDRVPEPIQLRKEPLTGKSYLLYHPSHYDRELSWPLVVVCHSSFPDSPNKQIRQWTELAESHGIVVIAPKLRGVRKDLPPGTAKQLALQRQDEKHILACIRHTQAALNLSTDRVFIHGFAGGAYAALHTGLAHPELFRAISVLQPRFQSGFMTDVRSKIDPYQSVLVDYGVGDAITGKYGKACVEWLREQRCNLREDALGPARASDTRRSVKFFEDVVRRSAWIRMRSHLASKENPLAVGFAVTCSYRPDKYRWQFGDGDESPVAEPIHHYAKPGDYAVTLTLRGPDNRRDERTLQIRVPLGRMKRGFFSPE